MLLAGSGSQQERGWPGPGAQLVVGRMAFEGWVDPWQWLGHWISAAEGQLWGAHGQIRKCRQRQYWKRMTCRRKAGKMAELGARPTQQPPEVLKRTENVGGSGSRAGFKS